MIIKTETGWKNLVTKQPVQFQQAMVEGETKEELLSPTERIAIRIAFSEISAMLSKGLGV